MFEKGSKMILQCLFINFFLQLIGLESPAVPESIHNFTIDARGTGGLGKIVVDIVQDKQSLPHTIDRVSDSIYKVSLHTRKPGKYRVYIYFNGSPVKGECSILFIPEFSIFSYLSNLENTL